MNTCDMASGVNIPAQVQCEAEREPVEANTLPQEEKTPAGTPKGPSIAEGNDFLKITSAAEVHPEENFIPTNASMAATKPNQRVKGETEDLLVRDPKLNDQPLDIAANEATCTKAIEENTEELENESEILPLEASADSAAIDKARNEDEELHRVELSENVNDTISLLKQETGEGESSGSLHVVPDNLEPSHLSEATENNSPKERTQNVSDDAITGKFTEEKNIDAEETLKEALESLPTVGSCSTERNTDTVLQGIVSSGMVEKTVDRDDMEKEVLEIKEDQTFASNEKMEDDSMNQNQDPENKNEPNSEIGSNKPLSKKDSVQEAGTISSKEQSAPLFSQIIQDQKTEDKSIEPPEIKEENLVIQNVSTIVSDEKQEEKLLILLDAPRKKEDELFEDNAELQHSLTNDNDDALTASDETKFDGVDGAELLEVKSEESDLLKEELQMGKPAEPFPTVSVVEDTKTIDLGQETPDIERTYFLEQQSPTVIPRRILDERTEEETADSCDTKDKSQVQQKRELVEVTINSTNTLPQEERTPADTPKGSFKAEGNTFFKTTSDAEVQPQVNHTSPNADMAAEKPNQTVKDKTEILHLVGDSKFEDQPRDIAANEGTCSKTIQENTEKSNDSRIGHDRELEIESEKLPLTEASTESAALNQANDENEELNRVELFENENTISLLKQERNESIEALHVVPDDLEAMHLSQHEQRNSSQEKTQNVSLDGITGDIAKDKNINAVETQKAVLKNLPTNDSCSSENRNTNAVVQGITSYGIVDVGKTDDRVDIKKEVLEGQEDQTFALNETTADSSFIQNQGLKNTKQAKSEKGSDKPFPMKDSVQEVGTISPEECSATISSQIIHDQGNSIEKGETGVMQAVSTIVSNEKMEENSLTQADAVETQKEVLEGFPTTVSCSPEDGDTNAVLQGIISIKTGGKTIDRVGIEEVLLVQEDQTFASNDKEDNSLIQNESSENKNEESSEKDSIKPLSISDLVQKVKTIFSEERSATASLRIIQDQNTEHKSNDTAELKEDTLVIQNVSTIVSNHKIEESLLKEVDGPQKKDEEHMEDNVKPSLLKDSLATVNENALTGTDEVKLDNVNRAEPLDEKIKECDLLKEELCTDLGNASKISYLTEDLTEGNNGSKCRVYDPKDRNEDSIKVELCDKERNTVTTSVNEGHVEKYTDSYGATHDDNSSQGTKIIHDKEEFQFSDLQAMSSDRNEEAVDDEINTNTRDFQDIGKNNLDGDNKNESLIKEDSTQKEVSTAEVDDNVLPDTPEKNSVLVKEVIYIDLQAAADDKASALVKEEQVLPAEQQEISCDQSEENAIGRSYEREEVEIIATNTQYEETQGNSLVQTDCSQTECVDQLEHDSANISSTEGQKTHTADSALWKEEPEMEKPMDFVRVPPENIKAPASSQDTETSFIEQQEMIVDPHEISYGKTKERSDNPTDTKGKIQEAQDIALNYLSGDEKNYPMTKADGSQNPFSTESSTENIQLKASKSVAAEIPYAQILDGNTEMVDLAKTLACKQEESLGLNASKEHVLVSGELVANVSSTSELSEQDFVQTDAQKTVVEDKISDNECIGKRDLPKSSAEDVRIPDEENETEQKQDNEPGNSKDVSESNNLKDMPDSSNSVALEKVPLFNVMSETDTAAKPSRKPTTEMWLKAVNVEDQKQGEELHVFPLAQDSSTDKIENDEEPCYGSVTDSEIPRDVQKLEEKYLPDTGKKLTETTGWHESQIKKDQPNQKDEGLSESETEEAENIKKVHLVETKEPELASVSVTNDLLLKSFIISPEIDHASVERRVVTNKEDVQTGKTPTGDYEETEFEKNKEEEGSKQNISGYNYAPMNIIDTGDSDGTERSTSGAEAPKILQITTGDHENQKVESISITETSALISPCERDNYEHGCTDSEKPYANEVGFEPEESKTNHEAKNQMLETIDQVRNHEGAVLSDIVYELTVVEDVIEPKETTEDDVSCQKINDEDEDARDDHIASFKTDIAEDPVKQETKETEELVDVIKNPSATEKELIVPKDAFDKVLENLQAIQAEDEVNPVYSADKGEEGPTGAVTWINPTEDEHKSTYIAAENVIFPPHIADETKFSNGDAAEDVPEENENSTPKNENSTSRAELTGHLESEISGEGVAANRNQKGPVSEALEQEADKQQLDRTFEPITKPKDVNFQEEKLTDYDSKNIFESNVCQSSTGKTAQSSENKETKRPMVFPPTLPAVKCPDTEIATEIKVTTVDEEANNKVVENLGEMQAKDENSIQDTVQDDKNEESKGQLEEKLSHETTKITDKSEPNDTDPSQSDPLQEYRKETTPHNEELHTEEADEAEHQERKTDGEKDNEDPNKLGQTEKCSEAPVMVDTGDADVKVGHKKSHNILSGVGSKVKHSIAKVKKAITGKSTHPKPPSPK